MHRVQFSRDNTFTRRLLVDVGDYPFRTVNEYETFSFSEPGRLGCTYKNAKRPTSGWLLDKPGY